MIVVTSDHIPGHDIVETLGLVRGTATRSRHLGKDVAALFKNIVGGEIEEYTKLLAESREQALDRARAQAQAMGADAIIALRYSSSMIATGVAEILAYGTAVKLG